MISFRTKLARYINNILRPVFKDSPDISSNDGSGIIQVLVAVAILGVVATLFSTGLLSNLRAKKQIESSGNFGSVEQAFANELAAVLNSMSSTNCLSSSQIAYRSFGSGSGSGGIRYTSNIGGSIPPGSGGGLGGMLSGSDSARARDRCTHPLFIPSSSIGDPNYNRMYFCLEFDKVTSGAAGSFMSSDHSFAEVAVYLRNSLTNGAASCTGFLTDKNVGAQVFYTLFWTNKVDNKITYKKKNGTMFAKSPAPP